MNEKLREYLDAAPSGKYEVLKKQYFQSMPEDNSEKNTALFHLEKLIEYSRRLNILENHDAAVKSFLPSSLRKTDIFTAVKICAESIGEDPFLSNSKDFQRVWIAFEKFLKKLETEKIENQNWSLLFLTIYLCALILRRHIMDGMLECSPNIFSIEPYTSLFAQLEVELFRDVKSSKEQLEKFSFFLDTFMID